MWNNRYLVFPFVFAACLGGCANPSSAVSSTISDVDANGFKIYRTSGIIDGHDTLFANIPLSFSNPAANKGRVERLDYTTDAYDNGVTYNKYLNVYLPYGYDASSGKTYDILYYQHGNTHSQDNLVRATEETETKNQLDHLFEEGRIAPFIMVFQSYYMEKPDSLYSHLQDDLAGDSGVTIPANYFREMSEDILPAVERKYPTYAKGDVSDNNLRATRSHRGFAGYSRGSGVTWSILAKDLDYFQWFVPMCCPPLSSDFRSLMGNTQSFDEIEVGAWSLIHQTLEAHAGMPFYIYATTGNKQDIVTQRTWANYLLGKTEISYGFDPSVNNFGFTISSFVHTDYYVPYYLYNAMQVVFH